MKQRTLSVSDHAAQVQEEAEHLTDRLTRATVRAKQNALLVVAGLMLHIQEETDLQKSLTHASIRHRGERRPIQKTLPRYH